MMRAKRRRLSLLASSLLILMIGIVLVWSKPARAAPVNTVIDNGNLISSPAFFSWVKDHSDSTTKQYLAYYKQSGSNATLLFPYAIPNAYISSPFVHTNVLYAGSNPGDCTVDSDTIFAITVRSYRKTCTVSKQISPNTTVIYYVSDVDSGSNSVSQNLFVSGLQDQVYVASDTWLFKKLDSHGNPTIPLTVPDRTTGDTSLDGHPNILSAHNTCGDGDGDSNLYYRCAVGLVATSDSSGYIKIDWINRSAASTHGEFTFNFYPNEYRTLTFDTNGGTIEDLDLNGNGITGEGIGPGKDNNLNRHYTVTLWEHPDGNNRLREYVKDTHVGYYPIPTWDGHTFDGWYGGAGCPTSNNYHLGGDATASDRFDLGQDCTLIAYWTAIPYTLTPHVDTAVSTVRAGDSVTFKPNVTNTIAYSNATSWNVRRIIIPAGGSIPYTGTRTTGTFGCSYYTTQGMSCTDVDSSSQAFMTKTPTYVASASGYTYPVTSNLPFGTQVCYALYINSSTQEADKPAEALTCVVVVKTPRLQVWGNDVRVGSSFSSVDSNQSSLIGTNNGSWGEYGVLAPSSIKGFGSAGSASGETLTFANTNPPPNPKLGSFTDATNLGTIPNVKSYLDTAATNSQTGIRTIGAPATISGGYEANVVYETATDVTITHDIINPSTGANLTQMVIIARNIYIDPSVKQVDAWLIASGTIDTCPLPTPTADNCKTVLTINGPIMANQLKLNRTGGDEASSAPAEIVNLRGDAYIWMRKLSGLTGTVRTVYTRELAPRY